MTSWSDESNRLDGNEDVMTHKQVRSATIEISTFQEPHNW